MASPGTIASPDPARFDPGSVRAFRYDHWSLGADGVLACHYRLDDVAFTERVHLGAGAVASARLADPAVDRAARLVFLLAGVSYYKAAAPPVVDLGRHALTDAEHALLRSFYVDGLGEFAYRNGLDLTGVRVEAARAEPSPVETVTSRERPLVPFGGGIDSIVSVEHVARRFPQAALFVASRAGNRFAAIERAAAVASLPVVRADREVDPKVLRSAELGYRNGHVPVTGVLSSIAVLAAVLDGRGVVVMSNEWSASSGNVDLGGRSVNHQFSKSAAFERLLRAVLAETFVAPSGGPGVDWFSLLRPYSELRIADEFAKLTRYHDVFRSCNKAFYLDPGQRLDHWCGHCDKCCFIDLILAPFVPAGVLARIFGGAEPLADPALLDAFRTLVGLSGELKPWECVGDVDECRAAALLASARDDRAGAPTLGTLARELHERGGRLPEWQALMTPQGEHFVPDDYAPADLLG